MRTFKRNLLLMTIIVLFEIVITLPVSANGTPVKVFLNYLPEISNYGQTEAYGEALVSFSEGWIDLTANQLTSLPDSSYEVWLATADKATFISLGKFNTDPMGHVDFFNEFVEVPTLDYRFVILSVENEPDLAPEIDGRWSIAGVFPELAIDVKAESPNSTEPQNVVTGSNENDTSLELMGINTAETKTSMPGVELQATPTVPPPNSLPVTGSDRGHKNYLLIVFAMCFLFLYSAYRLWK